MLTRVDDLFATLLRPGVTVFDDGASDDMKGQQGRDWFIGDFHNSSRNKDKADIDGRTSEGFFQLP